MELDTDTALALGSSDVQTRGARFRAVLIALTLVLALAVNVYARAEYLRAQQPGANSALANGGVRR